MSASAFTRRWLAAWPDLVRALLGWRRLPVRARLAWWAAGLTGALAWWLANPGGPTWGIANRIDHSHPLWRLNDWVAGQWSGWWLWRYHGAKPPRFRLAHDEPIGRVTKIAVDEQGVTFEVERPARG